MHSNGRRLWVHSETIGPDLTTMGLLHFPLTLQGDILGFSQGNILGFSQGDILGFSQGDILGFSQNPVSSKAMSLPFLLWLQFCDVG